MAENKSNEQPPKDVKFCPFRNTPIVQMVEGKPPTNDQGVPLLGHPNQKSIQADIKTFQCMKETCGRWDAQARCCSDVSRASALWEISNWIESLVHLKRG